MDNQQWDAALIVRGVDSCEYANTLRDDGYTKETISESYCDRYECLYRTECLVYSSIMKPVKPKEDTSDTFEQDLLEAYGNVNTINIGVRDNG